MKTLQYLFIAFIFFACNNPAQNEEKTETETKTEPQIKSEAATYSNDSVTMNGYIAYDENIEGARPAVLIIHEWWGLNDYAKRRARELAELGYMAMAIDLYGDGKTADNPKDAGALAGPFYNNPDMAQSRFRAAVDKLKTYPQTDQDQIAAIGYCFGGAMVLNMARLGEDLDGVISFHGNLIGVPLKEDLLKAKVLVLHGNDDQFVKPEEVAKFKQQMDSINADYEFIGYPNATHAFTNPNATATGEKYDIPIAYNAEADTASFKEMKQFFEGLFE